MQRSHSLEHHYLLSNHAERIPPRPRHENCGWKWHAGPSERCSHWRLDEVSCIYLLHRRTQEHNKGISNDAPSTVWKISSQGFRAMNRPIELRCSMFWARRNMNISSISSWSISSLKRTQSSARVSESPAS